MDNFLEKRSISWLATGFHWFHPVFRTKSLNNPIGHYAGIDWVNTYNGPRPRLVRAIDQTKDQTYYLSGVRESSLRKVNNCILQFI